MGSHGPIPHGSESPLRARDCIPSRLAPRRDTARGRSSPYGAPGRLPAPGQVFSSRLHKTLLSGPGGLPCPGRDPRQPQHCLANGSAWPDTATSPSGCPAADAPHAAAVPLLSPPLVPSRAAPLPAALLGGLCHPAAEVLMVLCPALNYFPDCHRHVLASGAGCDPAEPDAAAAAWGANGRSTPHVEFNYWLSSLTEYIG